MAKTTTQTQAAVEMPIAEAAPAANLPAPRARTQINPIVPQTWQEITHIAGAICRAKMAPKSYCDQQGEPYPDKVAIAIMHGMEVGMTPMASLQSLAVINGNPSLYGDGMLAVVRASGLLEDFKEELEWDDKGPLKATCRVKRRGEPTWGVMDCARADAEIAGWWGKSGPWKLTPHRMLQMRARGWALRDKFADVLRGLHSAEEMEDLVDVTPRGSATTGPAPAEPKREDPKYQQPSGGSPHNDTPSGDGQGVADKRDGAPAGGGESASSQPGPAAEKAPPVEEKPAPKVTDVEDQNEKKPEAEAPANDAEEMTFPTFKTARAFFEFSDPWLEDKDRTAAQATKWEECFHDRIIDLQKHDYQRIRTAIASTLALYHAVMKKGE